MPGDRALQVVEQDDRRPRAFLWRGRRITITNLLDHWEEAGSWWLGEEPRRVFRVMGSNGTRYELHHQAPSGWQLHRIFD